MSFIFHQELARQKIKFLLTTFSHKYFMTKNILDAGAGNGDIGAAILRLGGNVTAIECRDENIKTIKRKYPAINTIKADLEKTLTLNSRFDVGLSFGTLCHLTNYEAHLKDLCSRVKDLILETAVCDSDDPEAGLQVPEDKNILNLSFSGTGSRPSAARIEKILSENGMHFVRLDLSNLNFENYVYDWKVSGTVGKDLFLRRLWVCSKNLRVVNEIANKYRRAAIESVDLGKPAQNLIENNDITKIKSPLMMSQIAQIEGKKEYRSLNFKNKYSCNKKFVIVIPSYKNEKWAERNILSCLNQNYNNYRIILTDDCSPDKTFEIAENCVANHTNKSKVKLIKNNTRIGALENLYNMIYSCDDDEIIITLDGDDWLSDPDVLNKLNLAYQEDVWMTYGQYKCHPQGGGHCKQIPDNVIKSNNFRQYAWLSSHLRTFYTWLFKKIDKSDLMYEGKFAPSAWDMYIMFPMLEMSGTHSKFISDILYIYNLENPINDHKVDLSLQQRLDKTCRSKRKYSLINDSFVTFKELGHYGRIGNQLFQVAAVLALTLENNSVPKLNWYCNYTKKDMSLYFKNKIKKISHNDVIESSHIEPKSLSSFKKIKYYPNINLHGYFQSELYFKNYENDIRFYFEPSEELLHKLNDKYGEILQSNTCSIHVRRGDYVGNSFHEVCDLNYYNEAILKIKSLESINNFLIFSDDITWCKNNFPNNFQFIEGNLDIEDIFLMSLCKHNIISNSSFSWWGSYLNKNLNKKIIAPKKWFGSKSDVINNYIYTENMIKI